MVAGDARGETLDLSAVQRELEFLGFAAVAGSIAYLPAGRVNDNFRLRVGETDAILRVWKLASHQQAAAELTLLRHLAADGVPCPRPSPFQPDDPLTFLGGPAAFFDVLPGGAHQPKSWEAHVQVSHEVARVLGGVHLAGLRLPDLPYRQQPHSVRLVEYAKSARAARFGEFHERCLGLVDRVLALSAEVDALASDCQLEYGVVHGDPGSWNVMVDEDTVYLLDFDMAHRDLLCYDLGQLLSQWAATNESACDPSRLWDGDMARGIVDAYAEVRPLSKEERRAVALCVPLRQALDVLGHMPTFVSPDAPFPLEEALESFAILGIADDREWIAAISD